jgi:hypothetical protein
MTLLAVAPHRAILGVEPPGTRKKIRGVLDDYNYDWRCDPGSDANTARIEPSFEVLNVTDALGREYATDAHLVTYVVTQAGVPLEHQPRVNKPALDWIYEQGFEVSADVLIADVDNPDHRPWDDASRAMFDQLWAAPPTPLTTCGLYLTKHGYRLIQPLDEPIAVSELERYIVAWHVELEAAGVDVDQRCRDWTRLYRLPHVRRDGKAYVSPFVDLDRMQPRTVEPVERVDPKPDAPPRAGRGAA